MHAAFSLCSHGEARTEPVSATPYIIVSRSEARRPTVNVYILIVKRLAGGILGVQHGVAAFVIQFLECYYNAATCCYLVDSVLFVVRDSTALKNWRLRISGSRFRRKKNKNMYFLVWPFVLSLVAHWPGIVHKLTVI